MPDRERLVRLYRTLTAPGRHLLRWQLDRTSGFPIAILFYHRVADRAPNGWTISCADFARHLDWLQGEFELVGLPEVQRRLREGRCPRPTVAITFDDGYADNCDFAIPELVRRGIPAAYFVATDFVEQQRPFPHDVQAGQPLAPNTIDQIRCMQAAGVEIGAHTVSHLDLGAGHPPERIEREIIGSVRQLEDWIGAPVGYFAFPFGLPQNTSQTAIDVIQRSRLDGFCTAYGAWNWPGSDGFHLRRIHADPGIERLKNWLTFDPRKMCERVRLPFETRRSEEGVCA